MTKWVSNNWKVILAVASLLVTCAITVDTVRKMEPKVDLNTEHRITAEVEMPHVKEDIAAIKKDLREFTTEQRQVNTEILLRLPK